MGYIAILHLQCVTLAVVRNKLGILKPEAEILSKGITMLWEVNERQKTSDTVEMGAWSIQFLGLAQYENTRCICMYVYVYITEMCMIPFSISY